MGDALGLTVAFKRQCKAMRKMWKKRRRNTAKMTNWQVLHREGLVQRRLRSEGCLWPTHVFDEKDNTSLCVVTPLFWPLSMLPILVFVSEGFEGEAKRSRMCHLDDRAEAYRQIKTLAPHALGTLAKLLKSRFAKFGLGCHTIRAPKRAIGTYLYREHDYRESLTGALYDFAEGLHALVQTFAHDDYLVRKDGLHRFKLPQYNDRGK